MNNNSHVSVHTSQHWTPAALHMLVFNTHALGCTRHATLIHSLPLAHTNTPNTPSHPHTPAHTHHYTPTQDLLTRHKRVVAQYLADNYQPFFEAYNRLLKSSNYVTRRQSLKVRNKDKG